MVRHEVFGMIKTLTDAHTLGINGATALLRDCGYRVCVAPKNIEAAVESIDSENSQNQIAEWVCENRITNIGFSYRLDPLNAVSIFGKMVYFLKTRGLYENDHAIIKAIHFAGLAPACKMIDEEYDGRIKTFRGGESAEETLLIMGVPYEDIPRTIISGCKYDKELLEFGRSVIKSNEYQKLKPFAKKTYAEYGTDKDTIELRIRNNTNDDCEYWPVIRAHSGPYSPDLTRRQCLDQYNEWCKELAQAGFLDVLSIGSSQLSQSDFGRKWDNKPNGGGVPINSEDEYREIRISARPMLIRTYSGTRNVLEMAKLYERSINISWHALSLWWFDELDGRGPNSLYANLVEHIDTIKYIASIGRYVETNVPHHFAFRGCDDITYIISGYLGAKLCKQCGVRTFILQNMLNTPRSTWGIQDLAKSRTLIKLVKELEDSNFKVLLQCRAGLDYFKPDIDEAKMQLAAVTALMDDIDADNIFSPEIIHVVSYSEALFLATPDVLNDSIKITQTALMNYRRLKKNKATPDVYTDEIRKRNDNLERSARRIIKAMEESIPNLYTAEGLYLAFVSGWLPVPELWSDSYEFEYAKSWATKCTGGSVCLYDHDVLVTDDSRINRCVSNLQNAKKILKDKYFV